MNRYPLWKYIFIIIVMLAGFLFALPNLYPSQPAVQISSSSTDFPLNDFTLNEIKDTLTEKGLKAVETEAVVDNKVLIRFDSPDNQLAAAEAIKETLGKEYSTALNLAPATPSWLRGLNPMNLGLDLRGGVHFLMEVDMKSAIDKALTRSSEEFRTFLRGKKIKYLGVRRTGDDLIIQFKTDEFRDQARAELKREYRNEIDFIDFKTDKGAALKATLTELNINNTKRFALQQNITTLRKRVNELGVAEPVIQQQGLERIVVQLPGVQDPTVAKEILGTTATLEFRLVDEGNNPFVAQSTGRIPPGDKLFFERDGSPILLKSRVMLTGDYITDASAGFGQDDQRPNVSIVLDGKGGKLFAKATGANVQKLMAVVFIEHKTVVTKLEDGSFKKDTKVEREVINVARIQDTLSNRFQITGLDSPQESSQLALLLRAGALAAPVYIVEERTIGPSLGADNIQAGLKAFSTIADANITTLIAAIVLFGMGTGPIKGFAITLAIGIVSSMFTAIMGTRAVINLIYGGNKRPKKLHI